MIRSLTLALCSTVLVCVLTSCASIALYPGPIRPPNQVATINRYGHWGAIVALDGVPLKRSDTFTVLPGRHTATVSSGTDYIGRTLSPGYTQGVPFRAVAGHTYSALCMIYPAQTGVQEPRPFAGPGYFDAFIYDSSIPNSSPHLVPGEAVGASQSATGRAAIYRRHPY